MVTFTVDPLLFDSPKAAYLYLCKRRCLSRTVQDLRRGGYLNTDRYFYAIEWQRNTEQVHFHVLLDTSFVPFEELLASWSKHRPRSAGPAEDGRPQFGTVIFSNPKFASAVHAAIYATKYAIKHPAQGYPRWVMEMGQYRRVRKTSASRGFWGTPPRPPRKSKRRRSSSAHNYGQRVERCEKTLSVFQLRARVDTISGEVELLRKWMGKLDAPSSVLESIPNADEWPGPRRHIDATTTEEVIAIVEAAAGRPVRCIAHRRVPATGVSP
jgi:hypothetical protein